MKKITFIFILTIILFSAKSNTAQTLKSGVLKIILKTDSVGQGLNSNSAEFNIEINSQFYTYPDSALLMKIQGKVYFTIAIDTNCRIDSIKILKGLGYGLDEIATKVLQNLNIEVYKDNKPVSDCLLLDRFLPMRKFSSYMTFTIS